MPSTKSSADPRPPPELPEVMVAEIARHARSAADLANMICTCKAWMAADVDEVWRRLALARFSMLKRVMATLGTPCSTHKALYREHLAFETRPPAVSSQSLTNDLSDFVFTVELWLDNDVKYKRNQDGFELGAFQNASRQLSWTGKMHRWDEVSGPYCKLWPHGAEDLQELVEPGKRWDAFAGAMETE